MGSVGNPDQLADSLPQPNVTQLKTGVPFVLVVDDSAEMRSLLRDVLESRGYEVRTVASSAAAIAAMAERVPDLAIMDLMMPGMSGISLRALMLRRLELADVPVIVLSAYWARPKETLDAVAVFAKPVNLDRLIQVVDATCPAHAVLHSSPE